MTSPALRSNRKSLRREIHQTGHDQNDDRSDARPELSQAVVVTLGFQRVTKGVKFHIEQSGLEVLVPSASGGWGQLAETFPCN